MTKSKRIVDRKLLDKIKKLPCLICGFLGCDPHHIKTVGSGGDDSLTNVIPLCRKHHTEIHSIGLNRFSEKYNNLSIWLSRNNWSFSSVTNKWSYDNNRCFI